MRRDGVAEGEMKGDQGESGGEWGRVGESEAIDLANLTPVPLIPHHALGAGASAGGLNTI